ncbi:MAG: transcriptional regulator [Clostridia bacterium]|jgi:predicted transcriptional regulator|nr:helix-turn-helix domain-containing protein [Clostridiaceae bacterium]
MTMFDEYSDLFSSKVRLRIIAALISGPKDFTTLKKLTETTDGNLGKQMEILLEAGAVHAEKEFIGRRGKTVYSLTNEGLHSFKEYVRLLEEILEKEGTKE